MVHPQFDQFLREVLKLPMAVFEGPSFSYTEQAARMCFAQQVRGGGWPERICGSFFAQVFFF